MIPISSISKAIGVELKPCKSSNIVAYGWADGNLWILFKGDNLYKYPNQSKEQYKSLDQAESKGKWVNQNLVKPKAECEGFDVK